MKLRHFVTIGLLFASSIAQATTLDFNAQADNQYWINSTTSQGFTETTIPSNANGNIGLVTKTDGFGNTNGTVSLISWTNSGSISGFTLTKNDATTFGLSSFDFANGYATYDFVNSIDIIGTFANGTTTTQSFTSTWGPSNFVTLGLNSSFANLVSVQFLANGGTNRAVWDNINISNPVPAPATGALLLTGLGLIGFTARRRKQQ